jgi:hypothetical protein
VVLLDGGEMRHFGRFEAGRIVDVTNEWFDKWVFEAFMRAYLKFRR